MDLSSLDIAVCHGNYLVTGGDYIVAEKIAESLNAPIYIGFKGKDVETSDDIETKTLFKSVPARIASKNAYLRELYNMTHWEYVEELHDFDIIIQSGNEPGWYIPKDEQTIVKYCHAPPRTPYENFYESGSSFMSRLYSRIARNSYLPYTKFPTRYIVPSELVRKRVKKYWDIESSVIYPPIEMSKYNNKKDRKDYYLAFSRLHPDKRIYEIAEQFDGTDKKLIIGGTGQEKKKIKKLSDKSQNVNYAGFLSEKEKVKRLSECKALVFNPVDEAFGIVPAEAMASGAPVIGVKDGYTKYQIKDGYNGIVYDRGNLMEGIDRYERKGIKLSRGELRTYSKRYSLKNFEEQITQEVKSAYKEDQINMDYSLNI